VLSEKWNEVFKRLLENRVVSDRISTLQNEEEGDQVKFTMMDLSESDFPGLYKILQEKRDLALFVSYNKTEIKDVLLVYKLVERRKGKPSEPYYFPAFDYSKEPPEGLLDQLTSSQDQLLNQVEKQVIDFIAADLPELHLPPANSYIRRFEHQIAAKFGLSSSSQGEGRERHVVIHKGE